MVGWNETELIGKTIPFPYWPPEDTERFSEDYFKLTKGNVPNDGIELPFRHKNGSKFWGLILNSQLLECSKCGFLITVSVPPEKCSQCNEKCDFLNVTCYTPECGGPGHIDPRL
jgi:rubredoxin